MELPLEGIKVIVRQVYDFGDLQAAKEYLTSPELEAARLEMQQTWKEKVKSK